MAALRTGEELQRLLVSDRERLVSKELAVYMEFIEEQLRVILFVRAHAIDDRRR